MPPQPQLNFMELKERIIATDLLITSHNGYKSKCEWQNNEIEKLRNQCASSDKKYQQLLLENQTLDRTVTKTKKLLKDLQTKFTETEIRENALLSHNTQLQETINNMELKIGGDSIEIDMLKSKHKKVASRTTKNKDVEKILNEQLSVANKKIERLYKEITTIGDKAILQQKLTSKESKLIVEYKKLIYKCDLPDEPDIIACGNENRFEDLKVDITGPLSCISVDSGMYSDDMKYSMSRPPSLFGSSPPYGEFNIGYNISNSNANVSHIKYNSIGINTDLLGSDIEYFLESNYDITDLEIKNIMNSITIPELISPIPNDDDITIEQDKTELKINTRSRFRPIRKQTGTRKILTKCKHTHYIKSFKNEININRKYFCRKILELETEIKQIHEKLGIKSDTANLNAADLNKLSINDCDINNIQNNSISCSPVNQNLTSQKVLSITQKPNPKEPIAGNEMYNKHIQDLQTPSDLKEEIHELPKESSCEMNGQDNEKVNKKTATKRSSKLDISNIKSKIRKMNSKPMKIEVKQNPVFEEQDNLLKKRVTHFVSDNQEKSIKKSLSDKIEKFSKTVKVEIPPSPKISKQTSENNDSKKIRRRKNSSNKQNDCANTLEENAIIENISTQNVAEVIGVLNDPCVNDGNLKCENIKIKTDCPVKDSVESIVQKESNNVSQHIYVDHDKNIVSNNTNIEIQETKKSDSNEIIRDIISYDDDFLADDVPEFPNEIDLHESKNSTKRKATDDEVKESQNPFKTIILNRVALKTKTIKQCTKSTQDKLDNIYKTLSDYLSNNFTLDKLNELTQKIEDIDENLFASSIVSFIQMPNSKSPPNKPANNPLMPVLTYWRQAALCLLKKLNDTPPSNFKSNIYELVMENIEYKLFQLSAESLDNSVSNTLARIYAIICHMTKQNERLRSFCTDALYCSTFKALPIISAVIEIWPFVLPKSGYYTAKDPLVVVLMHTAKTISDKDQHKEFDLAKAFHKYGYVSDDINDESVLSYLLECLQGPNNFPYNKTFMAAFLLYGKRMGAEKCCNKLVIEILLPILDDKSVPSEQRAFVARIIGPLVRPFPSDMTMKCNVIIKKLLLILRNEDTLEVEEAIIFSVSVLSSKNYDYVVGSLLEWCPKAPVSQETLDIFNRLASEKGPKLLKRLLLRKS